jgi:hypothetical protein
MWTWKIRIVEKIVEKLDRIGSAGVLDAHGGLVHEVEVGGEVVGRGIGHKVWKKRKGID